jgi:integrase
VLAGTVETAVNALWDAAPLFATTALDDGHDYREVSEWLGHADYATTLRVYAHCIPDTRENK